MPPDRTLSNCATNYETELQRTGWICIGQGGGVRVYHRTGDPEVIKVSDGNFCYARDLSRMVRAPMGGLVAPRSAGWPSLALPERGAAHEVRCRRPARAGRRWQRGRGTRR